MCWMVRTFPSPSVSFILCRRGPVSGLGSGNRWSGQSPVLPQVTSGNWFTWLSIPLRIAEVMVGLHEIVDGEVVLAVIEPRAAADDLFELNHRVDGPHQRDVADVAGVHAGRELL